MSTFAIISVEQYYDGAENLICVGVRETAEDAEILLQQLKLIGEVSYKARLDYVDKWVDRNVEDTNNDTSNDKYIELLSKYHIPMSYCFHKTEFKINVKRHLLNLIRNGHKLEFLKDFELPEVITDYNYLFVVEIK